MENFSPTPRSVVEHRCQAAQAAVSRSIFQTMRASLGRSVRRQCAKPRRFTLAPRQSLVLEAAGIPGAFERGKLPSRVRLCEFTSLPVGNSGRQEAHRRQVYPSKKVWGSTVAKYAVVVGFSHLKPQVPVVSRVARSLRACSTRHSRCLFPSLTPRRHKRSDARGRRRSALLQVVACEPKSAVVGGVDNDVRVILPAQASGLRSLAFSQHRLVKR